MEDLKYLQLYDYERFQAMLYHAMIMEEIQVMLCYVCSYERFQTKLCYVIVYESFKSKQDTVLCLYNTVFKEYDSMLCFND